MIKKNNLLDNTVFVLMVFLVMAFVIFEMESWGRYVLFGITVFIVALFSVSNDFKYPLIVNKPFQLHIAGFVLFCLLSSVWAWSAWLARSKATTLLSIFLCFAMIYPYFQRKGNIDMLMDVFLFSGYGIVLYTIAYYGISEISAMLEGNIRIGNDFTNANTVGLLATISCLIQFSYLLKGEKKRFAIFMLPCFVIIAISQSRKAMVMLVVGVSFLIMTRGGTTRSILRKVTNFLIGLGSIVLLVYILSKITMFAGVFRRFEVLFDSMNGGRAEDIRSIYRRIGVQQFFKTPILGIGIGNSLELLERVGQRRTYLHCNFVELLSCGGIVGFTIYYSIYADLLINLWRYRKYRSEMTYLCIVLLVLMLIMDYGMVTYYDKQQYLYFMCFFLQLDFVKQDSKKQKSLSRISS